MSDEQVAHVIGRAEHVKDAAIRPRQVLLENEGEFNLDAQFSRTKREMPFPSEPMTMTTGSLPPV